MATRFRLTNDTSAPAVSPALQSYSHSAPTTVRRQLLTSDASTLTTTAYAPDGSDHLVAGDALWCQFVSDGMNAGVAFTNGDTIKFAVQGLEAHAANNLAVQLFVSIVSSDGGTVRRTLRSKISEGTELATSLGNRFLSTTQDGATYTTVSGDRLVVELSVVGTPSGSGGVQGHNSSMRFGGSGAGGNLPENDTETGTTLNPWIEFVPNGLFTNPVTVTPGAASLAVTGAAPTVTASNHKVVQPASVSVAVTGAIPTISTTANLTVRPDAASTALTGAAPTVSVTEHRTVTPDAASVALSGAEPTVTASDHQRVTPDAVALAMTAFNPTVVITDHQVARPAAAAVSLTAFAPDVVASDHQLVTPDAAALTLAGFAPQVNAGVTVVPGAASLGLTAFAPDVVLTDHVIVRPDAAEVSVTGSAPDVSLGDQEVIPAAVILTLAAFAPTVTVGSVTPQALPAMDSLGATFDPIARLEVS